MTITLHIEFVGLCLWVDEPPQANEGDRPKLHVLLLAPDLQPPKPAGNGGSGHHDHAGGSMRHHARLFYDTAYDTPGAKKLNGEYSSIALEDKVLDLTTFAGELERELPGVPNLTEITGATVLKKRIGDAPGDLFTARVSLAAGKGEPIAPTAPWTLGKEENIAIAHRVRWTLSIDAPHLEWKLQGLNGRGGQPLTPLHPVDGTINLKVLNVPRDDLSPHKSQQDELPPKDYEMGHFAPFYDAVTGADETPKPKWKGPGGGGGPIGGNYNCGQTRATAK